MSIIAFGINAEMVSMVGLRKLGMEWMDFRTEYVFAARFAPSVDGVADARAVSEGDHSKLECYQLLA